MPPDFRQLIPHRSPMVFIDEVPLWTKDHIIALRTVREGDPFVEQGRLLDCALIELLAQAIAAGDAQHAASKGGRVQRGFLTGLTGLEVFDQARVGETVELDARCLRRMEGLGLFDARALVREGDRERLLARGTVKLYVAIDYAGEPEPRIEPPKWT